MGSSGSGSLTDYSKRKPTGSEMNDGGGSGKDACGKGFSTSLEEVSRCFYFINAGTVPPVGAEVTVFFNGVRLSIETAKGEEVGYLPTKYNYIRNCMADGFNYSGVISASSMKPVPSVTVDIVPV